MVFRVYLTLILAVNFFHPVHLTVTNLEYFESQGYFEAKIRFFVDDFQKILAIKYGVKPDFSVQSKQNKELIHRYLSENFLLWVNGNQVPTTKYRVKSYNLQDITLWVTVRIPYHGKIKQLKIQNKLMTDLYSDQSNMLIFAMKNIQKAFTFTKKHNTESISF